jgi:peptide/nickel transport system permease protein
MSAVRKILRGAPLGLSVVIFALVIAWAVFPGLFARYTPDAVGVGPNLTGPSAQHWFGTDELGRDLYTRVVYGASLSLRAVLIALLVALVGSLVLGLISGYWGGTPDNIIMRLMDVLLAIPSLLVALMLVTALGFGTVNVALAVGASSIASFSRLMRGEVLRVRESPFVEAARHYGVHPLRVIVRHIFPLARGPLLALVSVQFGEAIMAIAALSFLGFGAQPPAPEWGSLIAEGQNYLSVAWWLTTIPGLVVAVVVIAVSQVGRRLNTRRFF